MESESCINSYYSWTFSSIGKKSSDSITSSVEENLTFLRQFVAIFNQWGLAEIATIHYTVKKNGYISDSNTIELLIGEQDILNELSQKSTEESKMSVEVILDGVIIGPNQEEKLRKEIITIKSENVQNQEFDIDVHHISFLPCNPITGKKQHLIWKKNAPRLASALNEIEALNPHLTCINDPEFATKQANCSTKNVFYLRNMPYYRFVEEYEDDCELDPAPLYLIDKEMS